MIEKPNFLKLFFAVYCTLTTGNLLAQIHINADPLDKLKISVTRSVPAEVISLRKSTVAAQLTSTVTARPILVGDLVEQDSRLAQLDCADSNLLLEQSYAVLEALQTNRTLASQQLERLEKLNKTKNASEEEINQKQAELDVVKAEINAQNIAIRMGQRQIDKCNITSPFKGVITQVFTEIGNFVVPGTKIASITDLDNIELSAQINSGELDQIREAAQLFFLYREQLFPVTARTVLNVVDPISQNRHMRLRFDGNKPLPGSSGRLQWMPEGNILPASLIVSRNDVFGIFIVDKSIPGKPTARFIPIPDAIPGRPVTLDMNRSTLIVTDGRHALEDGENVILN